MTAPSPLLIKPRRPAQAAVPRPQKQDDTAASLLALDDRQFAARVGYDAHRSQSPDMLAALRDNVQRDLGAGRLEGTAEHRARTYLGNVRKRLAEAERLLAGEVA